MPDLCSIPCYKTHKQIHADTTAPAPVAASPLTATSTTSIADIPAPKPRRHKAAKPDFSVLESDPILADLMRKNPSLRIKLQSVYGLTLEPLPPAAAKGGFRPGYRGRGGFRGGMGGQQHWTPAKGDAEALERLGRLRTDDGEDGAVAEFVRLVGLRFGEGE
ncbi:hypothetical protein ANO11243_023980 [Dothideomycetidae sp. 11243]|nr:hypothetical protein ANO11243_023980 [fungal sp. No.11243]